MAFSEIESLLANILANLSAKKQFFVVCLPKGYHTLKYKATGTAYEMPSAFVNATESQVSKEVFANELAIFIYKMYDNLITDLSINVAYGPLEELIAYISFTTTSTTVYDRIITVVNGSESENPYGDFTN